MKAVSSHRKLFFKNMIIPSTTYYKNRLRSAFSPLCFTNFSVAEVSDY